MDERVFRVGRAEFKIARNPAVIETIGLGSCVGIILYDRIQKIGGLAHVMLPYQKEGLRKSENEVAKFADSAIEIMINQMLRYGANEKNFEAMLFGGADMFSEIKKKKLMAIGERNVIAARDELERRKIKIVAEETGGMKGRTLRFHLEDTSVEVLYATGEKKVYVRRS